MPLLTRRRLLAGAAAVGGGIALGCTVDTGVARSPLPEAARGRRGDRPGPLRGDPAGLLALPAGFRYTLVSRSGSTALVTGEKSPRNPDGTGAFTVGGRVRLVQNHEITPGPGENPVPIVPGTRYDAGIVGGGCTVIETSRDGQRLSEWVALSGTVGNCAGGVTPWNTWLSCEETEDRAGTGYGAGGTARQDHGFVFEVAPARPGEQHPAPIKAWGRYPHEAVVVAPDRQHVFLTEDVSNPNGLLYRWTAPNGLRLRRGVLQELGPGEGRLQALQVVAPDGGHLDDLSRITGQYLNQPLPTAWIDVPDRLAADTPVRQQFDNARVTRNKKLEGAWGDAHGFYFDASSAHPGPDLPAGSVPHDGQIWYYHYQTETLTLRAYFPYVAQLHVATTNPATTRGHGVTYLDEPDNLHVTPWGGLVIAEDGDGDNHLFGWTEQSGAWPLARNEINTAGPHEPPEYAEFTGPTFSPLNSRLLYANVQQPGVTYAITGDFHRYFA
jgi:secreted PhoX family phosphatase